MAQSQYRKIDGPLFQGSVIVRVINRPRIGNHFRKEGAAYHIDDIESMRSIFIVSPILLRNLELKVALVWPTQ